MFFLSSDTDVRELFPEFRSNSVLRFSRLFPIKAAHKPRLWKGFKKRKKKLLEEQAKEKEQRHGGGSSHPKKSGDTQQPQKQAAKPEEPAAPYVPRLTDPNAFDFAPFPEDPDMYEEDDCVRFHRPADQKSKEEEDKEERESESKGPKQTDWRWGPAQYWYDLLGLPETVEHYDYGLKSALDHMDDLNIKKEEEGEEEDDPYSSHNKENTHGDSSSKVVAKIEPKDDEDNKTAKGKILFPDDAFLMVTQVSPSVSLLASLDNVKIMLEST